MSDFHGKVVLVTGASSGIGRETALAFARSGASLVLADVLETQGFDVARLVEAAGAKAFFARTDVSDERQLQAAVASALKRFGRLDIAVNNAGVEQSGRPIVEVTSAEFTRIIGINVGGVLFGMKHEIPAMIRSGGGSIVNLASIAGLVGFVGAPVYVASKHAVIGLTKTAALECAGKKIRVNAVCPGAIQTEMIDRFVMGDAAAKRSLIAQHPLGRIGQPKEVADAIVWLASDEAAFVTGHCLTIDGGYTAQ